MLVNGNTWAALFAKGEYITPKIIKQAPNENVT
jgi:hypothetical protein